MSIVTINNLPYSRGREIAEKVAEKTGRELITGEQVAGLTAEGYHLSPEKIKNAYENPQVLLGTSLEERRRHLACYEATLMRCLLRDNIVFCGFAGRVLLDGISHVFKTYITSSLADRVLTRAARENIQEKAAEKLIVRDDNAHKKLIKALYNFEDTDPKLYDMALNIGQVTVEDAIEIISMTAAGRRFQPMTYSIATVHNIELMYRVRAALIHIDTSVSVCYESSGLIIHSRALESEAERRTAVIKAQLESIPEAARADIVITEDFYKQISSLSEVSNISLSAKYIDFIKRSVYISDLCETVKGLMERYDIFLGKNTIVVIITCLDDQCTTVIEYIKRELRKFHPTKFDYDTHDVHLEKFYSMRLFGGLFIPKIKTYECLLPAAHHIPDKENGNLLIFNFTHIGYDDEKKEFGTLVRHGHSKPTPACGAIISCYEKIRQGTRAPRDNDLKILSKYLKGIVNKYDIIYEDTGLHLLELTARAYELQGPWLKGQLTELAKLDNINIIYIGGIEVDFSRTCEEFSKDKIVVMDKFFIDKKGSLKVL